MRSEIKRQHMIGVRLRPHKRELIEAAAEAERMRPTEFAGEAAMERARRVLKQAGGDAS